MVLALRAVDGTSAWSVASSRRDRVRSRSETYAGDAFLSHVWERSLVDQPHAKRIDHRPMCLISRGSVSRNEVMQGRQRSGREHVLA